MAVSVNISRESLANENSCLYLQLPKAVSSSSFTARISNNRYKAEFLSGDPVSTVSRSLARFQRGLRRSLLYIHQVFQTMPKTGNLTATAPGASTSRVNRAKTVSKSRQTKADLISQKSHAKFAGLNNLRIFAVQNARLIVGQSKSIHTKFADKARSFLGVSFGNNRYGRSAKHQKSLAFFGYIHQVF